MAGDVKVNEDTLVVLCKGMSEFALEWEFDSFDGQQRAIASAKPSTDAGRMGTISAWDRVGRVG